MACQLSFLSSIRSKVRVCTTSSYETATVWLAGFRGCVDEFLSTILDTSLRLKTHLASHWPDCHYSFNIVERTKIQLLLCAKMVFEHDSTVSEYQHEKHRPREAEALHTLRKVASLVKPIMRQRGWRVGVLTEFYPPETNLLGLNWNKGQKICLRLRYPGDANQFLPLEQVVDTMLHE